MDGSAGSLPRTQLDGLFVGRFEWKVRSTPGPCHQRFTWIRVDVGARGQRSAGLAPVSPGLQAPEGAWGGGGGGSRVANVSAAPNTTAEEERGGQEACVGVRAAGGVRAGEVDLLRCQLL